MRLTFTNFANLIITRPHYCSLVSVQLTHKKASNMVTSWGSLLLCICCMSTHFLIQQLTKYWLHGWFHSQCPNLNSCRWCQDIMRCLYISCQGSSLGLNLNCCKCEANSNHPDHNPTGQCLFQGFQHIWPDTATLLGTPLSTDLAMDNTQTAHQTCCWPTLAPVISWCTRAS